MLVSVLASVRGGYRWSRCFRRSCADVLRCPSLRRHRLAKVSLKEPNVVGELCKLVKLLLQRTLPVGRQKLQPALGQHASELQLAWREAELQAWLWTWLWAGLLA